MKASLDTLVQADNDGTANMLDEIVGDEPVVERSSMAIDAGDSPKPALEMTLVEQLKAQVGMLKPAGSTKRAPANSENNPAIIEEAKEEPPNFSRLEEQNESFAL